MPAPRRSSRHGPRRLGQASCVCLNPGEGSCTVAPVSAVESPIRRTRRLGIAPLVFALALALAVACSGAVQMEPALGGDARAAERRRSGDAGAVQLADPAVVDGRLEPAVLSGTPLDGLVTDASGWLVEIKPFSAWTNLSPWAFWSVVAGSPRVVVELGAHNGFSYFAFCQAIERAGLPTRAYAVDTWLGDEHANFYGEEVFAAVQQHNQRRYAGFSTLLRMTFDEALDQLADGSVDLLHIDGRHYYQDVRHDFESWLPKLSERAVVLFHDIEVLDGNFGVWRLWGELTARYPHFSFRQPHGLGILGVGAQLPGPFARLFALDEPQRDRLHRIYEILGQRATAAAPLEALE